MSFIGEDDPNNINADNGPMMVQLCVSMMVLSGTAVVLRLISRRVVRQSLQWDDWVILMSLVVSWGACLVEIIGEFARLLFPVSFN
jgi:hypothetical protein